MNNSEWLTQLAKEAPDELAKWFDAEHVDMERDYVDREFFNAMCDECQRLEGERDDALEIRDKACGDAATFKYERDEWKAKYLGAVNDAEDYKTLWQRSREGSSKVRAGQSKSAKRAAAVERLWSMELHQDSFGDDIIDALVGSRCGMSALDTVKAICDLLSDDELPVPSSSPNGTSNGTANGTCPDGDETCPNHSKAHSKTVPSLTEQPELLSDEAAITERRWLETVSALVRQLDDAEFERDELRDKLEDDWKYVSLKEQVDLLTVRAVGAEQEADELTAIVDRLTREREKLREKVKHQTAQLAEVQDALERRNKGELKKRWQKQVDELQGELDYCRKRYAERMEHDLRERDYWREQVRLCLDSAYPPSHSPERSYNPDVMGYPNRHGCTTPSSLVSAVIDGLRDERAAQYMALVKELTELKDENEKLKAEVIQYAKDCGECGTAMPKGVSWPRFADGSLLRYGDLFLDGSGDSPECHCVEFIDPKTTGLGASTIIHGNIYGIGGKYDGISYNLFKGKALERPTEDEGMA